MVSRPVAPGAMMSSPRIDIILLLDSDGVKLMRRYAFVLEHPMLLNMVKIIITTTSEGPMTAVLVMMMMPFFVHMTMFPQLDIPVSVRLFRSPDMILPPLIYRIKQSVLM